MTVTDIASRTYNHSWRLDPIIRSLLDTDFYKLLMLQMIRESYPGQQVTFSVINRSRHVRLAEIIDEGELRAQLDHARTLRFTKKELIWLAGNTFYGKTHMFSADFIRWLAEFRLPEYELRKVEGQYELHFHGPWTHTTMWEIPALAILNELRSRAAMKGRGRFELDVLYARAKAKLWTKVERLRQLENLRLSDFGTRRRHGFLWQRWCVEAVKEGLGPSFIGTSNVLLAMDNDLEAIGTNAHELPMVAAALAKDDEELRWAPYRILDQWRQTYGGNLLIALPDAFGTKAFLRDAPEWVADWTGFRPDSAPRSRPARRSLPGGRRRAATRRTSCSCFPTRWMSARSRRPITTSPAASGSRSAGAPTSPTISSAAHRTARSISIRSRWSARCRRSTDARPSSSPTIRRRPPACRRRSSVICACSATPAASARRCWSSAKPNLSVR